MICENAVVFRPFQCPRGKTGKSHPNRIHVFSPFRHALTMPAGQAVMGKIALFCDEGTSPPVGACTSLHISITAGRYPPGDIILNTEKMRECQFDFFIQLDYYQGTGVHSVMKSKRRKSANVPTLLPSRSVHKLQRTLRIMSLTSSTGYIATLRIWRASVRIRPSARCTLLCM